MAYARAPLYALTAKRIWVAGHRGMVGSALVRRLAEENCEILTATRDELDLRDRPSVEAWVAEHRPDAVILAAATVGGILANSTYPADFLHDNLSIAVSVMAAAYKGSVEKLLFLGSSCIYPKFAEQPIREDALLTGPLEPTNQAYAVAKIAGLKLAQAYRQQHGCDFISAMPTNLYGPGDNFDLRSSHVLPALIRKTHEAKIGGEPQIVIWGTGTPHREFMHVDDCAGALVHILKYYSEDEHVNVGVGGDIAIRNLAAVVTDVVGYDGRIATDPTKPDGTPRKLLNVEKLHGLGWTAKIDLREGIAATYRWYQQNIAAAT